MSTVIKYKPAKHSTLVWVAILTLISLILNGVIIFVLFQVRNAAKVTMVQTAVDLDTLANEHFQYTVKINQTVPIATDISIKKDILVPIGLTVDYTIPIKTEIPFKSDLNIPLTGANLGKTLPISATFPFNQVITVPLNLNIEDILPASALAPFGREIVVPLNLDANQLLPVSSTLLLDQDISVPIDLKINQE